MRSLIIMIRWDKVAAIPVIPDDGAAGWSMDGMDKSGTYSVGTSR